MKGVEAGLVVAIAAAISAGIVLALLPILRRHALAHPNARSSHRTSTPQGGGIAVIVAAIVASCGVMAADWSGFSLNQAALGTVFAATVFIAVVGAADDIWTIEVVPRLLLQTLAVVALMASLPAGLRVVASLSWWLEWAILLVACLWFVNLTNFMDGIDWMTVAEFVPMSIGLAVVGWLGAMPPEGVIVALALCGGLLGFAPFNRPVARIFLGDVGSLPIGLLFAWLLVLLAGNGHLIAALILPLYYLADATLTLLRRVKNGDPFWQAHRTHFYQLATDRGFNVPQVVARVFAVNLVLVALAGLTVARPGFAGALSALTAAAGLVGWLLWSFSRGRP